jgi:electron transfer flavoprotein beta subunit
VLKQSLFRGADRAVLISDKKFAAADTLATSYTLTCAIRKLGHFDLVFCGRQAIDGDTAQVGPQTAEKLGINQITSVAKIESVDSSQVVARRSIEGGFEKVRATFPLLLTFTDEWYMPRPPSAKAIMQYKSVAFGDEEEYDESYIEADRSQPFKNVALQWDMNAIEAQAEKCGLSGSPTKVKKIESAVLSSSEITMVENTREGIAGMLHQLKADHTIE